MEEFRVFLSFFDLYLDDIIYIYIVLKKGINKRKIIFIIYKIFSHSNIKKRAELILPHYCIIFKTDLRNYKS